MVHMGPQYTQCGRKPARLTPVLQMGLSAHKRPLKKSVGVTKCGLLNNVAMFFHCNSGPTINPRRLLGILRNMIEQQEQEDRCCASMLAGIPGSELFVEQVMA